MSEKKEKKEIIFKNIGYKLVFDWPMQLARHGKKCTKPASETEKKKYILKDEVYVCCICNISCAHQSNKTRHTKACNGTTRKEMAVSHVASATNLLISSVICKHISKVLYANVKTVSRDLEE